MSADTQRVGSGRFTGSEAAVSTRLAYSVADAVAASGIGRTTLYSLMASGQLAFVKLGNRTLIRRADLEELLERNVTRPQAGRMDKLAQAA